MAKVLPPAKKVGPSANSLSRPSLEGQMSNDALAPGVAGHLSFLLNRG